MNDIASTLLFLQLIIQIQDQLSGENRSLNVFEKPEHVLSFVKHVLDSVNATPLEPKPQRDDRAKTCLTLDDLRFVPEHDDDLSDGSDPEDETSNAALTPDDDMTETSINLVLSILEGTL
jgi:hypothetical protein